MLIHPAPLILFVFIRVHSWPSFAFRASLHPHSPVNYAKIASIRSLGYRRISEAYMGKLTIAAASLGASLFAGLLTAQVSTTSSNKIDFGKDVLPILRQNCVACHGPSQQNAGLRLDRRSSVFKIGARRIVPGNPENSFIYHRLIDSVYGPQMPPSGPLRAEQIAVLRTWIEQGAEWPDSLANEVERPPLNPKAVAMVEMLRNDNLKAFMKVVAADPKLLNARGPDGATPFMYAVLYADSATLATLLKKGADPNKRSDANATALMWAASDPGKTLLLVQHGADVNAKSDELRTPLMIAARHPGMSATLKLLLDRGRQSEPQRASRHRVVAAGRGRKRPRPESIDLLLNRGADTKGAVYTALSMAAQLRCSRCLDLLAARITDKAAYTAALNEAAAVADFASVKLLVDHGADVNAFDPRDAPRSCMPPSPTARSLTSSNCWSRRARMSTPGTSIRNRATPA